jgi:hypothetical protein
LTPTRHLERVEGRHEFSDFCCTHHSANQYAIDFQTGSGTANQEQGELRDDLRVVRSFDRSSSNERKAENDELWNVRGVLTRTTRQITLVDRERMKKQ